jgi:hypothetical protein
MGVQRITSEDWRTYRWLCKVEAEGLNPLRIYGPADVWQCWISVASPAGARQGR